MPRTGGSSLTAALRNLDYLAVHDPKEMMRAYVRGVLGRSRTLRWRNAVVGNVGFMQDELQRLFPDAGFILTVRDPDCWLASARAHFDCRYPQRWEIRAARAMWFDGCTDFDEDRFRCAYQEYKLATMRRFAGHDNLLVLEIGGGREWSQLERFLGVPPPKGAFPRVRHQDLRSRPFERLLFQ